jgi:hypothetical protein
MPARGIRAAEIAATQKSLASWPFPELHRKPEPVAAYVPPPAFDLTSLPLMQQVALINCTESHVRRTLTQRMLSDGQCKPTWQDYARLVEKGLAVRRPRDGYHNLTPEGRSIAAMIIPQLCLLHDVHLITESSHDRWQTNYRCPCGFLGSVRRSNTAPGNANAAHFTYVERETRKLAERQREVG